MGDTGWLRNYSGAGGTLPSARQLYQTFELLFDELENEETRSYRLNYLADFTQRWGALSLDRLLAIARDFAPERPRSEVDLEDHDDLALYGPRTSEEADVCFVLAALSVLRAPETSELLLLYLGSQYAIERWLASLGLVMMHDERVLPALEQMLVEFVGPNQPWTPESGSLDTFRLWRHQLLRMLANWGDPRLIPSIREGLIATVRGEEVEVPEPHGTQQEFIWQGERFTGAEAWQWFHSERMAWVDEEHLFVYTLGQLSAYGALVEVPMRPGVYYWRPAWGNKGKGKYGLIGEVPENHANEFRANVWRVHMCFGTLESEFRDQLGSVFSFAKAPELSEAVERLLAEKFGMNEVTRHQAMADYDQAGYVAATVFDYRRFAEQDEKQAKEGKEGEEGEEG